MNYRRLRRFNKGVVHTDSIGIGEEASGTIRGGQNIRVRSGSIEQRAGIANYCDFSLVVGGIDIQTMNEYSRENWSGLVTTIWSVILVTSGTKLYYIHPESSTTVLIEIDNTLVLTSPDIYGVNIYDHFIFGNGQDAIMVTDGEDVFLAGIVGPAAAPTQSYKNNAGAFYRRYKYTYFRNADPYNKESADSDELTMELIAANPNNGIAYVQAVDSQVTHYRIYATIAYDDPDVPETDFYLMAEITLAQAIAAGFIYNDTGIWTIGAAYDTTDRGVPPVCHKFLWHDNRLFCIGDIQNPSLIYYSEVGKPWYFPTNNWDEIGRDDGDVLTALGSIGPTRYIFKIRSIYEWTGDPESVTPIRAVERRDASMNMNKLSVGCKDPRSLAGWRESFIYRAEDGHVYMLTHDSNYKLSGFYDGIVDLAFGSVAVIHNDYYIISSGGETHVCYLPTKSWQGQDTGLNPTVFLVDHNGYLLGAEGELIERYYTGTQDKGIDFVKSVTGPYVPVTDGNRQSVIRRIHALCRERDSEFDIEVYNESELIGDGTYAVTDKHFSMPNSTRGKRADYCSVKLSWEGTAKIEDITMHFLPRRRH